MAGWKVNSKKLKIIKQNLKGYAFIAPNYILMLIFLAFPVFFSFILAFSDWDLVSGLGNIKFIGFANFVKMLTDKWFLSSLFNNFYYTLTVVPASLFISLIIAVLINDYVYKKEIFRMIIFLPNISNIVAVSIVWALLYSDYGPIVSFLRSIGVENPPVFLANRYWAMPAIIIMSIWLSIGYSALIYSAGLQSIPQDIYETSYIDGANWWQRFFKITVPMLSPTTFFLLITSIISSFKVFGQIQVMTDGGPMGATSVLVYYIYKTAFKFYKFGYASAMALVLFIIILVFTIIQWRGQKKWVNY